MTLDQIYQNFVREGIKDDPRTQKQLSSFLGDKRRAFRSLSKKNQVLFDKESLRNPYADTRILWGDPKKKIRRVMVGIDIGVQELILADHLSKNGRPIDLVLAHHPIGIALAALDDVMHLQTSMLSNLGLDPKVAQSVMNKRILEVARGIHSINHMRVVDAAKLLNMPLMCCHTPSDNLVARYLQRIMDRKKPSTLKQIIDILMKEPEYKDAARLNAGPKIWIGKTKSRAGRILVDMTGGTSGSKDIFPRLSQLGINTILGMHMSEGHYQRVRSEFTNVVIAGHMASDNLGLNLLLDRVEKKTPLEIIDISGFRRVRR